MMKWRRKIIECALSSRKVDPPITTFLIFVANALTYQNHTTQFFTTLYQCHEKAARTCIQSLTKSPHHTISYHTMQYNINACTIQSHTAQFQHTMPGKFIFIVAGVVETAQLIWRVKDLRRNDLPSRRCQRVVGRGALPKGAPPKPTLPRYPMLPNALGNIGNGTTQLFQFLFYPFSSLSSSKLENGKI